MSVSFNVQLSDGRTLQYRSRPCFASVNNATYNIDYVSIDSVRYLPFLQQTWDSDSQTTIDKQLMTSNMTWDIANRWWTYLLSLPYISNGLVRHMKPGNVKGYKHGFSVLSRLPADRVMLTLFLLRAPQFQGGIVRTFCHLIDKFNCPEDVAFVTAFVLNNTTSGSIVEGDDPSHQLQYMNPCTDQESSIIYPAYFSYKGAKLMLNRLLCDDPDTDLYSGVQPKLSEVNKYERYGATSKSALGRFFCKKPGMSYSTGNLQLIINNDILRNEYIRKHGNSGSSLRYVNTRINDDQMNEIIHLIQA